MGKKFMLYSDGSFVNGPDYEFFNTEEEYTEFITKTPYKLRLNEQYILFESVKTIKAVPNPQVEEGTVPEDKVYKLVPALDEDENGQTNVPEIPGENEPATPGATDPQTTDPNVPDVIIIDDNTTAEDIENQLAPKEPEPDPAGENEPVPQAPEGTDPAQGNTENNPEQGAQDTEPEQGNVDPNQGQVDPDAGNGQEPNAGQDNQDFNRVVEGEVVP